MIPWTLSRRRTQTYRSPRREAQARATRAAIVDAARARFVADGYTATTIDAVAQDAQVSAATVYGVFGTKRALLKEAMDVAIVGDVESVPLQGRDWVQALAGVDNVDERVPARTRGAARGLRAHRRAERVLEEAAATDPELAELAADVNRSQRHDAGEFRRLVAGDLRVFPEVSEKDERDAIWAVTGPARVYRPSPRSAGGHRRVGSAGPSAWSRCYSQPPGSR